jgi:hypothetical protein
MTRLVLCPCCERPASPRKTPITMSDAERTLERMQAKGWTVRRLLDEKTEDLDYIAPGLTDWLRARARAGMQ